MSQRVQAVNSSPVSPVCWSESVDDEEDWPDEWWHDSESDWMDDWQDDWYCTVRKIVRVNGTTMKVPIWCAELQARVQV